MDSFHFGQKVRKGSGFRSKVRWDAGVVIAAFGPRSEFGYCEYQVAVQVEPIFVAGSLIPNYIWSYSPSGDSVICMMTELIVKCDGGAAAAVAMAGSASEVTSQNLFIFRRHMLLTFRSTIEAVFLGYRYRQ